MSRPTSAPESSSSSTGSSGALAPWMKSHQPASPRSSLDSRRAVRNEEPSSTAATARIPNAQPVDSKAWGWTILSDPLDDGEGRSQGEQDDGHHEAPEVALPAEAERVRLGGGVLGPAIPQQQQELVAGVGQRVHALGQHRRRTGEGEAHELGHGDAQVGQQGDEDRTLAAGGGHPPVLLGQQSVGHHPADGQRRGRRRGRRVDHVHQAGSRWPPARARRPRRRRSRRAGCRRGPRPGPARRCPPGPGRRRRAPAPAGAASGPGPGDSRIGPPRCRRCASSGGPTATWPHRWPARPRRRAPRRGAGSPGGPGPAPRWVRRAPSRRAPG